MRLSKPRIAPLSDAEADPEVADLLQPFRGGPVLNIFRTMARTPKALLRFNQWGGYVLSKRNSLAERERELVILRTGYLCKAGYEWTQHKRIGLDCGLTEAEIERIKSGPDAGEWSAEDAALLRATDDLVTDHFIGEAAWDGLAFLTEKQKMDLVYTVCQYTQVSMLLNSFGVQVEDGASVDPDLKA